MTTLVAKLFVTGQSQRSQIAIRNIRSILEDNVPDEYSLTVIDVLENPVAAEEHRILATPTLLKSEPLPSKRIIGDLSNRHEVIMALEINNNRNDDGSN